jgi:hypothetical protein
VLVGLNVGRGRWGWIDPDGLWKIAKPLIPPSRVRPQGGETQDMPDETVRVRRERVAVPCRPRALRVQRPGGVDRSQAGVPAAPGHSTTSPTTTATAKGISMIAMTLRRCHDTGTAGVVRGSPPFSPSCPPDVHRGGGIDVLLSARRVVPQAMPTGWTAQRRWARPNRRAARWRRGFVDGPFDRVAGTYTWCAGCAGKSGRRLETVVSVCR